jgi:hypothetical protein
MGLVPRGFYLPHRCKVDCLRLRYNTMPEQTRPLEVQGDNTFNLTYTLPMGVGAVMSLYESSSMEDFSRDIESAVGAATCCAVSLLSQAEPLSGNHRSWQGCQATDDLLLMCCGGVCMDSNGTRTH